MSSALSIANVFRPSLMTFTYLRSQQPDRVVCLLPRLEHYLYAHTRIRLNAGKLRVWSAAGIAPAGVGRMVCLPSPFGRPTSSPLSCLSSSPPSPTPLQRSAMLTNGSLTRCEGPPEPVLGPFASRVLLAVPTSPELSLEPPLFRMLLLQRPGPLSAPPPGFVVRPAPR